LTGFWLKWGWVGDVSNVTYAKHKCISDFFGKWGAFGFRGMYWFVCNVRWVSRVVGWPDANANSLLVYCRDFEFGVSDESVEVFIPTYEEPGVVDEFEG
jgi:hypothetical protein